MLSRSKKPISLILTLLAIGLLGCRTPQSAGKLFQLTRHEGDEVPEFEAPRQRLATTKPRAGSVLPGQDEAGRDPEANRPNMIADTEKASDDRSQQRAQVTSEIEKHIAAKQAAYSERSSKTDSNAIALASAEQPIAAKQNDRDDDLTEQLTDEELMQAFADTTPEVKEQALRQLLAVLSRSAEPSSQPADLLAAFQKSLRDDHQLPAAKNKPADIPVNRLAADLTQQQSSTQEQSISGGNRQTDRQESESDPGQVVTVSAENIDQALAKVKTAAMQDDSITQPEPKATAASNADIDSMPDQLLYQTLLARVAKSVEGESDAERARRLITARHLMVLAGDPDAAVREIDGMTNKEQEYLRHQLLGLWTMVDPDGHPVQSRRFSSALPQLREATKYLAAATDSLEIPSLAFCTEIMAYGQIKKFSNNRFASGQQVILYCEVENFVARKVNEGYQTHLQGSYDILNADNRKVSSQLLPADEQISSNYLRDYFIAYQMNLPKELSPGNYRLQLTMEDVEGKKYGQASIPFEIEP